MTTVITYKQAINQALGEEMRKDPDVYFMGEDIGVYGGSFGLTHGLIEEFGPERIMETPISETAFVGAGIGSAITGLRPVVELMFSDFIGVCYDQIINQGAKMRYMFNGQVSVPMVLRMPTGARTSAAAQHTQSLENLFCHIPGLKVVIPSTPYDAKGLLKAAIRDNNLVIFLEPKVLYPTEGEVPKDDYLIPLGVADVKRAGTDISVITYGSTVQMSLKVAEKLETKGISVEVLDLRTLSPLDVESIHKSVKKTGRAVVVHEAVQFGGFGGEIVSSIVDSETFSYLKAPVKRVGAKFSPIPFSKNMEDYILPSLEDIENAIMEII